MKRFSFKKIDAFARGLSSGNPAGAIFLTPEESISPAEMQKIAFELKGFVSEVGFVRLQGDEVRLRYYSSVREVDFCGHATIAILYDLLVNHPTLAQQERIQLVTEQDRLEALNRLAAEDAVYIRAPAPRFGQQGFDPAQVAKALRTLPSALHPQFPLAVVQVGLKSLMVPLRGLEELRAVQPDLEELNQACQAWGCDIVTLFTPEVHLPHCAWRSRVFAATFGYLEDPATGSGNSALGHYLLQQRAWAGNPITVEQGTSLDHPNQIQLRTEPDATGQLQVWFGGGAVTRISGHYHLAEG